MLARILLIFMISLPTFANELSIQPLLRLLDPKFIEQEQNSLNCQNIEEVSISPKHHGHCMVDICGKPTTFGSVIDHVLGSTSLNGNGANLGLLSLSFQDPSRSGLEDKVNRYFNLRKNRFSFDLDQADLDQLIISEIERLVSDDEAIELGVFLKATLLRSNEKMFENFIDESADFNTDTLEVKFKPEVYEQFRDDPAMKKFTKSFEKWLNETGMLTHRAFDTQTFIALSYPNVSFEVGIQLYLEKVRDLQTQIDITSPLYGGDDFNVNLFLNKLSNQTLSETDLKVAVQSGLGVETRGEFLKLVDGTYPKLIQSQIKTIDEKINTFKNKGQIQKLVARVKEAITDLYNFHLNDNESKLFSALNSCLGAYDYNKMQLPSDAQVNSLKALTQKAKVDYISSLSSYKGLSSVSKPIITSLLSEVRFSLPQSQTSWTNMIEENLNQYIATEENRKNRLNLAEVVRGLVQATVLSNSSETIGVSNLSSASPINLITETTEDPISSLCEGYQQEPFSDATLTATGIVLVSYTLALMPPNDATSVLFHELSHNLEEILSNGVSAQTNSDFQKNKQCINELHSYLGVEKTDGKFFKEDFADFMAAELLPKGSHSGLCHFLDFDRSQNTYDVDTFQVENEVDPHSNTAFRILRFSVDNNESLPKSCVEAMAYEGITQVSKTCSF